MFFTSNLATLNTTSTPQPHSRPPSKTRSMRLQQQQQPSSSASTAEQEAASHVQKAKSTRIEALKSDNRDLQPKPGPSSSRKYQSTKNKTMAVLRGQCWKKWLHFVMKNNNRHQYFHTLELTTYLYTTIPFKKTYYLNLFDFLFLSFYNLETWVEKLNYYSRSFHEPAGTLYFFNSGSKSRNGKTRTIVPKIYFIEGKSLTWHKTEDFIYLVP